MTIIHKSADIHNSAEIANCNIGEDTRIWQFVVVLDGAVIGSIRAITGFRIEEEIRLLSLKEADPLILESSLL